MSAPSKQSALTSDEVVASEEVALTEGATTGGAVNSAAVASESPSAFSALSSAAWLLVPVRAVVTVALSALAVAASDAATENATVTPSSDCRMWRRPLFAARTYAVTLVVVTSAALTRSTDARPRVNDALAVAVKVAAV